MFYHLHWLFLIASFAFRCAADYKISEVEANYNFLAVTKYRKYKNWQNLDHMAYIYPQYEQYREPCGIISGRILWSLFFLVIWIVAAFLTWIVWLFQNLTK